MALPVLRHLRHQQTTANAWTVVPGSGVGANRALVCRVLLANNTSGGQVIVGQIAVHPTGSTVTNSDVLAASVQIGQGETYEQAGVVVVAGESISVLTNTANLLTVQVFGEEVDN